MDSMIQDMTQEKLAVVLDLLETLSKNLVAKAAPVEFRVAQDEKEREIAYRLRYQALLNRGAIHPEEMPDGMERDEFDERGIQVLGWAGVTPIATGRLVPPAPDLLLPTEKGFGLSIEPRGQVIDIGRYVVTREYAVKESRYFAAMLGFCWLQARSLGFMHVCGTASAGMLRHYRRLGFIVTELAAPQTIHGEDRYPCWYDVIGSANVLLSKWSADNTPATSTPGG